MPSYAYFRKNTFSGKRKNGHHDQLCPLWHGCLRRYPRQLEQRRQPALPYRLKEHYERLMSGCRVLNIKLPYTAEDSVISPLN